MIEVENKRGLLGNEINKYVYLEKVIYFIAKKKNVLLGKKKRYWDKGRKDI